MASRPKSDIVFQNSNGTPLTWEMNGTSVIATANLANPGTTWHAIGTGDYNGDGKSDILFENVTGTPADLDHQRHLGDRNRAPQSRHPLAHQYG